MKLHDTQYLGLEESEACGFEDAKVVILPFPYEGGVSYGKGTALAPRAALEASAYLELYDEELDVEPFRVGITTLTIPEIPETPEAMSDRFYAVTKDLLESEKFIAVLGGDHSITSAYFRAIQEQYGQVSVIQLDAHADLRDSYEGSKLSHASVMARIREMTPNTLQIGIRSLSKEEADLIKKEHLSFYPMHAFRKNPEEAYAAVRELPNPVFITLDVDVFDWSVIGSTGTPEPGGLLWDEAMSLLKHIFKEKEVVGFDVVELCYQKQDRNSPFAVAKLIYKMLGYKYFRENQ